MKVVVGLGNPGREYEGTRHNVGFLLLRELSLQFGGSRPKEKFDAENVEVVIRGERVLLLAPQTYMNASGRSVKKAADFYQLAPSDLLVACDDLNLPLGKLRLRRSGSSGGQKGLEDIIRHLGTQEFSRLRIGIDAPPAGRDAAAYVLGRFGKSELAAIESALQTAIQAIETWVGEGVETAMNRYNSAASDSN
jgi:PTH1 family peptidyl-tRNA hydrolase